MARLGYIFENAVAEPTRCSTQCWGNTLQRTHAMTAYYWGVGKRKDGADLIVVSNPSRLDIIVNCIFETTYNCDSGKRVIPYAPQAWSIEPNLFQLEHTNILSNIQSRKP